MDRRLTILMLGGAKRVSIGRMLIAAGKSLGCEVELLSYELDTRQPIAEIARIIVGRRWADPEVEADLCRVCRENGVDIILPFVDGAIAIAARVARQLPGLFAPVSAESVCQGMFDKIEADTLFRQAGLPVPERIKVPISVGEIIADQWKRVVGRGVRYPIIAKPRTGSASKGIRVIESETALLDIATPADYLFQEYVADREEFTVDCYIARDGHARAIVPRRRIEVIGGEVSRTATVENPELIQLSTLAISKLRFRGAVTIQFLRDRKTGRMMLMEVNPRLGGGVVCSVHAGADIPAMILRESLGMEVPPATYRPGTEIARYMQEVVVS